MWPRYMRFIRRLYRGKFYLSSRVFKFCNLLDLWQLKIELQLNISKIMPARLKQHRDMGCDYYYWIYGIHYISILACSYQVIFPGMILSFSVHSSFLPEHSSLPSVSLN